MPGEYEELDAAGEDLTLRERKIGWYEQVRHSGFLVCLPDFETPAKRRHGDQLAERNSADCGLSRDNCIRRPPSSALTTRGGVFLFFLSWLSLTRDPASTSAGLASQPHLDETIAGEVRLKDGAGSAGGVKKSFGGEVAAADGAFHRGGPAGLRPVAS